MTTTGFVLFILCKLSEMAQAGQCDKIDSLDLVLPNETSHQLSLVGVWVNELTDMSYEGKVPSLKEIFPTP